jgi:hypothetical protein
MHQNQYETKTHWTHSIRQFGAHGWQEPDGVRMRQADGPFGVDRPIVRMLTVEQFAGAGWRPRSSER